MDQMVLTVQKWLNNTYGSNPSYTRIPEDGITGGGTVTALITALQIELHIPSPNGVFGPATYAACPTLPSSSAPKNEIYILQGALYCKGYNPNGFDGGYGNGVMAAIKKFQSDAGLAVQDGITTPMIFKALLNTDAFVLISGGDTNIRTIQQNLNKNYNSTIGLIPCDGIYSRLTNTALIKALQKEQGTATDGFFGTDTMNACPTIPGVNATNNFILLLQYALYCNHFNPNGFDGLFGPGVQTAVINFQKFAGLDADGYAGPVTWASLLVSTGDPSRKGQACDCATTITAEKAQTLVDNDYKAVGRYLTGMFAMTVTELETIYGKGIKVFPIFETAGTRSSYFTDVQGQTDAIDAMMAADKLGFLPGTIIYFAVDYDAIDYEVTNYIIPYFKAISDEFSNSLTGYKVGIYGPRNVCSRVAAAGYSCSSFVSDMSSGFSGNLGYSLPNDWAFDQISTITIGNESGAIEIDNNILSNKYSSLYQTNANDWTTDAINRGWGPISEDSYYKKMSEILSESIRQSTDENIRKNVEAGIDWTPSLSNRIGFVNAFYNNETTAFLNGVKEYDTNKPGFMRVYEYDVNGTIHLKAEYKLKPAELRAQGFREGLQSGLKLKFLKGIDKGLTLVGIGTGVYADLIRLEEEGQIQSMDDFAAALASTVVFNGATAYICGIITSVISQVAVPELPVVSAVIGGLAGAVIGYVASALIASAQLEEILEQKFKWLFNELLPYLEPIAPILEP